MCRYGWCLVLACLACLNGCGDSTYEMATVRGRVTTCEGKPAVGGVVIFYPSDAPEKTGRPKGNPGREARGTVGEDGTFMLTSIGIDPKPGAVVGPHRVAFEMPPTRRPTLSGEDRENMSAEEITAVEEELAQRPVYEPLPCTAAITPGEVEVKAGENLLEFTLPAKSTAE